MSSFLVQQSFIIVEHLKEKFDFHFSPRSFTKMLIPNIYVCKNPKEIYVTNAKEKIIMHYQMAQYII